MEGSGGFAGFEASAVVAGFDDLAVVSEAVQEGGCHLGVAEDGRPFNEGEVGGDDDGGPLVEAAHQVEEQLTAGLGEGQIAKFVEDDEVEAGQMICDAALAAGAGLGLEAVDQIDDAEEAARAPARVPLRATAMARWLLPKPFPPMSTALRWLARKALVASSRTRASWMGVRGEVEVGKFFGERQPGDGHLVLDGAGLLLGDLGLEQVADDALHRMLALEAVGEMSSKTARLPTSSSWVIISRMSCRTMVGFHRAS